MTQAQTTLQSATQENKAEIESGLRKLVIAHSGLIQASDEYERPSVNDMKLIQEAHDQIKESLTYLFPETTKEIY